MANGLVMTVLITIVTYCLALLHWKILRRRKKCNSKSKAQSSKSKCTERVVRIELIAPILIGYLESLHNLAKAEKGKYEILNGKSLAEDIKRYIKILKSDWT